MIILVAVLIILVIGYFILSKIKSERKIIPNEEGYIITDFTLLESLSNDMAEGGGRERYYFSLSKNTLKIETVDLGKEIEIELDNIKRENLEKDLLELIGNHSLKKWNGYDKWLDVLDDFHGFDLTIEYSNDEEITAHGDHMFPDDYDEVFEAVQSLFLNYIAS